MIAQRPSSRSVSWLGTGVGAAQLIAWGTIYYSVAVLAEPMQRDLAIARSELFASWAFAFSQQQLFGSNGAIAIMALVELISLGAYLRVRPAHLRQRHPS